MIYIVSEHLAGIVEFVILIWYLILALQFKTNSLKVKITGVSIGLVLGIVNLFIWNLHNQLLNAELYFLAAYFAILLTFSLIMLKGKWWHQTLLILIAFAGAFIINAVITMISSIILSNNYSELLLMRNPTRIFLLIISKIALILMLLPISSSVQKRKFLLSKIQYTVAMISILIMIIAGVSLEKLILDESISLRFATIIMSCIVAISFLLFFIFVQFSVHNRTISQRIALETRLNDDEVKLQETLQWSKSVKTLRHDLSNHLISISKYIESGDEQKALQYIEKITNKIDNIPQYVNTDNPTINAILDLKRMTCEKEKIDLKCYIEQELPEFDDVAFCTIFGNLMDNAIEAEMKEQVKEIRLALETASDYLHITIQNRIHKSILVGGKIPRTSKKDSKNHGLGLYSVTETISQMNGAIDFREENNWFIVDVLLPKE